MTITLDNGALRLVVNPAIGGAVVRFDALTPDGAVALMRPGQDDDTDPNKLAMYPLVPWSNRIAGKGFDWRGQHYPLAPNLPSEPCPIHGDGWQKPWQVVSQTSDELHLKLYSSHQPPFDYRAELTYHLRGSGLEVVLSVTHLGDVPAPYGLGMHPWFPRTTDVHLQAPAEGVWEVDAEQLPTEWRVVTGKAPWNFIHASELPADKIDNLFTGWGGRARLYWPERGLVLEVTSELPDSRYLVFSPGSDAEFFCFEPVSHDVDAHHFADPQAHGLRELQCGQTLEQRCRFHAHLS